MKHILDPFLLLNIIYFFPPTKKGKGNNVYLRKRFKDTLYYSYPKKILKSFLHYSTLIVVHRG